mmetsp:Transcript_1193/g.2498  ORF Transcript_1193/g.2498 Transcript_1193/m.2498 type:complete len:161 (-) Transcript_1193:310-792(-)
MKGPTNKEPSSSEKRGPSNPSQRYRQRRSSKLHKDIHAAERQQRRMRQQGAPPLSIICTAVWLAEKNTLTTTGSDTINCKDEDATAIIHHAVRAIATLLVARHNSNLEANIHKRSEEICPDCNSAELIDAQSRLRPRNWLSEIEGRDKPRVCRVINMTQH